MMRTWRRSLDRLRLGLFALVGLLAGGGSADAAFILFNTGVDASGNVLPDGATDPHYILTGPGGTVIPTRVKDSTSGLPAGWLGDNSTSRWIGPGPDSSLTAQPGDYVFTTTFDLTGLDPTTVVITGRWSSDNASEIFLNNATTGFTTPDAGFGSWWNFTLDSGFVAGINTLEFRVVNSGGEESPLGLRVEFSDVEPVPAPPAVVLFGVGVVGLAGFRALRRKVQAVA
jgi:hypothetical protein